MFSNGDILSGRLRFGYFREESTNNDDREISKISTKSLCWISDIKKCIVGSKCIDCIQDTEDDLL